MNVCCFVFFYDPATTEIYTLSLHDALPISCAAPPAALCTCPLWPSASRPTAASSPFRTSRRARRSEEHTSELQSLRHLVCRLLLEKKKKHSSRENMLINDKRCTRLLTVYVL